MSSANGPRVLVMGLGGIGAVVAGRLVDQGVEVTGVSSNGEIARAISRDGMVIAEDGETRSVRITALERPPTTGAFDYVLLATQPTQVEEAAHTALPVLAKDGAMVCFQNGLCEDRVASIAGAERTIGAIVSWGASMSAPGRYERTSSGGFTAGTIDGTRNARVDALARLLESVGPVDVTTNLRGARWSKLAINCAISSLGTLAGQRLGSLLTHRFVRRLALEIMSEAVEVARKEGVRLEKVSGTLDLDWLALTPDERRSGGSASLVTKHALLLAVGARFRRLRSSMLAAIERGRHPAVDFLNGEVVTRGFQHGVEAPVNQEIRDMVLAIAARKTTSSFERVRELYDRTARVRQGDPISP